MSESSRNTIATGCDLHGVGDVPKSKVDFQSILVPAGRGRGGVVGKMPVV